MSKPNKQNCPKNEPLDNPLYMFNSHCIWVTNNLRDLILGRILTIVDSSIGNEKQNKAMKDLIKDAVWGGESWTQEFSAVIKQFVEKFTPELKKHFPDLPGGDVPSRTYFDKKK